MPASLFCFVYGGMNVTGIRRHGWLRAGAVHHADLQMLQTTAYNSPDGRQGHGRCGRAVIYAVRHIP